MSSGWIRWSGNGDGEIFKDWPQDIWSLQQTMYGNPLKVMKPHAETIHFLCVHPNLLFYSATPKESRGRPGCASPSLCMWEKQFPGGWRRTIKVRLLKSSTSSQAFCSLIGIWGGWGHQGSSGSLWMTETLTGLFRVRPEQMSFRQNVINSMRSQPRASLSGYLSYTHIYTSAVWRVFQVGGRAGKHRQTRTHMQAHTSSKPQSSWSNL